MDAAPRTSPLLSYRVVVLAILLLGAAVSVMWCQEGRRDEETRAKLELTR